MKSSLQPGSQTVPWPEITSYTGALSLIYYEGAGCNWEKKCQDVTPTITPRFLVVRAADTTELTTVMENGYLLYHGWEIDLVYREKRRGA